MRHLKTILDTYRDGGHLSDDELVALRDAMDKLDELCSLNPMFYLTGNYARKVADDCREYGIGRRRGSANMVGRSSPKQ